MLETARRLRDLERVRDAASPHSAGALVAGSLGYGPCYAVRGGLSEFPSDIDLLILVRSRADIHLLLAALQEIPGVHSAACDHALERSTIYQGLDDYGHPSLFYHRIPMWQGIPDEHFSELAVPLEYALSLRVLTLQDAATILLPVAPGDVADWPRGCGQMSVYRDTSLTSRAAIRENLCGSFAGTFTTGYRTSRRAAGGHLELALTWELEGDRIHIGRLFTALVPRFVASWDDGGVGEIVRRVNDLLDARLSYERAIRPYELQEIRLAHARCGDFPPTSPPIQRPHPAAHR